METPRKDWKRILGTKSPITDVKNAIDGPISNLDMAKEKISKLEDVLIKTCKSEMQREKKLERWNDRNIILRDYPGTVEQL